MKTTTMSHKRTGTCIYRSLVTESGVKS